MAEKVGVCFGAWDGCCGGGLLEGESWVEERGVGAAEREFL